MSPIDEAAHKAHQPGQAPEAAVFEPPSPRVVLYVIGAVAVTLAVALLRIIAFGLVLALGVGACGHAPEARLSFTYHDANEVQAQGLDCVLDLFADEPISAGGNIFVVPTLGLGVDGYPVYGRTIGVDDYLLIDLVSVPPLPQAFAHELVHVLAGQETGDRDGDHNDPRYFGSGSLAERMMHEAYALCQPRGL